MRVALLTDGIWPYVLGGMQKHSYYLCKYLAQQKVEVDLFHYNESQFDISLLEFFTEEERKYIRSNIVTMPKSVRFPGHYLYNSYLHSKLIFENLKYKLESYDLIYAKGFTGWYLLKQKVGKRIMCPPIGLKFHGYEMFQKAPNLKVRLQHLFLLRYPVRSISRMADLVFSYGGKITDIIRNLGVPDSRIFELPSGVEQSEIAGEIIPVSGKIKFLYLGRYERRKGIEELNAVIFKLSKKGLLNKCLFNFIGPIPDDRKVVNESVFYHGEIRDKKKLREMIRQNDVLICPSWSEGMPNVILEAMANGLAVLGTDVGATSVLVRPSTGWLIKAAAGDELLSTIIAILKSDALHIDQKKQLALELIQNEFTWEKLILKFVDQCLPTLKVSQQS